MRTSLIKHGHLMTAAPDGDGGGDTASTDSSGTDSTSTGSDDGAQDGTDDTHDDSDDKAAAKARREAANLRQRLKDSETQRQTQLDAIAKALGLKGDDEQDPKALAAQLTTQRQETVDLRVENALLRSAQKAGGDPDALLDSTSVRKQVAALDPTDDDYRQQVEALIADAVKGNPRRYALDADARPATRSGTAVNGGDTRTPPSTDPKQRARDYYATAASTTP